MIVTLSCYCKRRIACNGHHVIRVFLLIEALGLKVTLYDAKAPEAGTPYYGLYVEAPGVPFSGVRYMKG